MEKMDCLTPQPRQMFTEEELMAEIVNINKAKEEEYSRCIDTMSLETKEFIFSARNLFDLDDAEFSEAVGAVLAGLFTSYMAVGSDAVKEDLMEKFNICCLDYGINFKLIEKEL